MRSGPPDEVLSGTSRYGCTVSSWLGGVLLAASVPVTSGRITAKAGQAIPEQLRITVPRYAAPEPGQDVVDWRPGDDEAHPLARYGQELQVSVQVTSLVTGDVWDTRVGRFVITDWSDDDAGRITVTADGLLRRVQDDKLVTPLVPLPTGTLKSEALRLVPPGMGVAFDAALVDRPCPQSMAWSEDRLAALQEIADAWPALLRTDEWGQIRFKAPLPAVPTPGLTLKNGNRGTVVSAPRSDTRAGSYNRVVARSSATATADIQAVSEQTTGPMAVTGPYGAVTKVWSSPLIGSQSQAQASADTMRANSMRPTRVLPVTLAPDPRIDLDDPLAVLAGATVPVVTVTEGAVARTNLSTNPSFETSGAATAQWGTGGAGVLSRATSGGWVGTGFLRATWTTGNTVGGSGSITGGGISTAGIPVVGGQTYTMSGYVRCSKATRLAARIDYSTGAIAGSGVSIPANTWVRLSVTASAPAGAVSGYLTIVAVSGSPSPAWNAGDTLDLDGVLIEVGTTLNSYGDGSTRAPDGYRWKWTGTPNTSTSVLVPLTKTTTYEPTERTWGYTVGYDLPLTVADGPMRMDLGVSA